MNKETLIAAFSKVKKWQKKGERAPHKPLTLLYALGEFSRGNELLPFMEAKEKIEILLSDFGPNRKTHANYPFVRLANDRIWTFNKPKIIDTTANLSTSYLVENNISAGFNPEVKEALKANPELIGILAASILNENFPTTLHEEILNAVGLEIGHEIERVQKKSKKRDPEFREKVLQSYSYQCAICGYQLRLGHQLIGVEAAHIKWHQAGGPDVQTNGLALCSLHHKMLDSGVFTLDENMRIVVSAKANGPAMDSHLLPYENKEIRPPRSTKHYPKIDFVEWHVREVYKCGY